MCDAIATHGLRFPAGGEGKKMPSLRGSTSEDVGCDVALVRAAIQSTCDPLSGYVATEMGSLEAQD